jgi:3'-5' exoribonuclease
MKYLSELKDGDYVHIILAVRKKFGIRDYKSKFGKYFVVEAGDRTGNVLVKYWGNDEKLTEEIYNDLKEGDVIEIKGTYQKDTQPYISVDAEYDEFKKVASYDKRRFIPALENIEEVMEEIMQRVEEVENEHLSKLLDLFFSDDEFIENFRESPYSSYEIYAYMGGLAEHTLNVVNLCKEMAHIYGLDRDFLITAALLHDVGKVGAYEMDTTIRQRDETKLLGHTVLSYNMVETKIREIVDFPTNMKNHLLHAIISHHSPIVDNIPQRIRTKEAYVLFYADMIDLSLKEFDGGEEEWQYSKRLGREIYLG